MGKTPDKLRQQKCREKRKKGDKAYQDYLEKDWLRKILKRLENKQKPLPEQEAHKVAERNRVGNYRIQKKKAEETKVLILFLIHHTIRDSQLVKQWKKLKNRSTTLLEKESFFLQKWQQKQDFRLKD